MESRSRSTSGATGDLRSADLKIDLREPSSARMGVGVGVGGGRWRPAAGVDRLQAALAVVRQPGRVRCMAPAALHLSRRRSARHPAYLAAGCR